MLSSFFKKQPQPSKPEQKEIYYVWLLADVYLHNQRTQYGSHITMDQFLSGMKDGFPDTRFSRLALIVDLHHENEFAEQTKDDHYQLDMSKYKGGPWEEATSVRLPDTINRHVLIIEVEPSIAAKAKKDNDHESLYPYIVAHRSDVITREKNEWELGEPVKYTPEPEPAEEKRSCLVM